MRGIHTIYSTNGRYKKFYYFELLQLILSSLTWRKYNGDINLYCDDNFKEVIDELDLSWLWDSIDYDSLGKVPNHIDTELFWTYPKMFVHSLQKEKFCSLDADLYVVKSIQEHKEDIVFSHYELDLHEVTYPNFYDLELFQNMFGFRELSSPAINTCLVQFNKIDVLEPLMEITNKFVSKDYTKFFNYPSHSWTIYCEQKLLGELVNEMGYSQKSLMDVYYDCFDWEKNIRDFIPPNYGIDHIWFEKEVIYNNDSQRLVKTFRLLKEIEVNFPEHLEKTKYLMKYCLE
jgi:hypothetical protein